MGGGGFKFWESPLQSVFEYLGSTLVSPIYKCWLRLVVSLAQNSRACRSLQCVVCALLASSLHICWESPDQATETGPVVHSPWPRDCFVTAVTLDTPLLMEARSVGLMGYDLL